MRKSLWIVPILVLVAAIAPPNSRADSFTYSYTAPLFVSWTTAPIAFAGPPSPQTTILAADLTSVSLISPALNGCSIPSVVFNDQIGLSLVTANLTGTCGLLFIQSSIPDVSSDFTTPGTYVGSAGDTLVVTAVAPAPVPEPSTVALILAGIGLVLVMRKRIA